MVDPTVPVLSKPALLRWWDAYPTAKTTSFPQLTAGEVAKLIQDSDGKGENFAVIDVRRADHAVGFLSFLSVGYF